MPGTDCVILLHGLIRSASSMEPMADFLRNAGYQVANIDYPSTNHEIAELADMAISTGLQRCPDAKRVHFVTHSLGGILVRQYLQQQPIQHLGRVVMLAPPNQGSEVVDALQNVPGYQLMNGPAGMQLGTDAESVPKQLGPVDFELGVIAGDRSINLILSQYLPNPDDGKVSVASTKVDGMADHLTVQRTHPFIMRAPEVKQQTLHFLQNGHFQHN